MFVLIEMVKSKSYISKLLEATQCYIVSNSKQKGFDEE